ncbi:5-oxoprolinase subunit C family protein [Vibrio paucivorans]|uniref:Biotin-dependent carboxyltransferase family protein n=1 Tax=Vibrio paucivorans TaxID=2829489 RepID=A0A9X3HSL7_9VIBR|nr:biotin-dependent carboxyltransferase family protein [Vibrio paucivorans]MCW8334933.1 biotin-dependent carboxyltransferase family protein [Vibrio paucivorans]
MSYLNVIKPGQLSLIQDFGRYGHSQSGVTQGGPVDDYAYSWANHLLSNPINSSTLEITLGQAEFKAQGDCELAIAGGNLNAKLDGRTLSNWSSFCVRKGQTLTFGLPSNGLRAYLAVKGGFNVLPQLGSTATVVRENLGGLEQQGLRLQAGDQLSFSSHNLSKHTLQTTFRYQPNYNLPLQLRVIESYQNELFSESAQQSIYQQTFQVSQHIDRMGYRLTGGNITPPSNGVISEGIALGSIQVPPNGEPIILLNDRQTIGGYPKFGCVARIDLPRLAQAKPGQEVQFVKGDLLGLQTVWAKWARFFGY